TSTPAPEAAQPTSTPLAQPESLLGRTKEQAPGQVQGTLAFTEPRGSERCQSPLPPAGVLSFEVKPAAAREYPDVFIVCLDAVANEQDVKVTGSPSGGTATLKTDFSSGAHWPPNGPVPLATYTLTASQSGTSSVTTTVSITEASNERVLVYPRRGA